MSYRQRLTSDGFAVVDDVVSADEISRLISALERAEIPRSKRAEVVYGARNLLAVSAVKELASAPKIMSLVEPVLGPSALAVRALFFDKTPGANWPIPYHQDLSIAVAKRVDLPGWQHWTCKAGVFQVQPPVEVLSKMLTVRIHLDDCGLDNGPLRIFPGSHLGGRLSHGQIIDLRRSRQEIACAAPAGSALFMRPLLVHASSPAEHPSHRRVVHIEFSSDLEPCDELKWAWS
jgi:ectoine hydroxylase-related dioxygenase (phytanoyl-CoA dioxygenase family)